MKVDLRHVDFPPMDNPVERPEISAQEYAARTQDLHATSGVDWVAVYGDREHNANLLFLTGFDPRFEEALLLLGPAGERLLLVGNEGLGHVAEARLSVDVVLYQPFSLMGQPQGASPPLADLFIQVGVKPHHRVGVVGWKYLDGEDAVQASMPAYVPALISNALGRVSGNGPTDVTASMMDPRSGIRTRNSAAQIAQFEWGAARASAAVQRVVRAARPGMSELEAVVAMAYGGEPLSCHVMFSASDTQMNGLRSPTARRIRQNDAVTAGVGYWGGLCCRAGVMTGAVDARFVTDYVQPYFAAITTWWMTVGVGITGAEVETAVADALGDARFRPALNPGHLGSYDEWVHSPIRPGSDIELQSGMVLQCDIIPTPMPDGRALNCEDTIALADQTLREQIANEFPSVWDRIVARRCFMEDALGIPLKPEVLPLSIAPGYLAPFWLERDLVCTVEI